jgi:hypothetical protein
MTITNDRRPTAPEFPAWLNLDGYCSPDIRAQFVEAADAIEGVIADPRFNDAIRMAFEVQRRFDREVDFAFDDDSVVLGKWSGYSRLESAVHRLAELALVARGEAWGSDSRIAGDPPAWWTPWGSELAEEVRS